ncbi:PfkB family carbohydrate kinase [Solirubrobacter soli]|uniref:PfkB family carbohydrate kinase n=1 Tax=Solirubrobacter soli TaxID=363832 RepID=UPI00041C450C|nr:PfkB family carbohydrate kinase [Solirubrobacter soli]
MIRRMVVVGGVLVDVVVGVDAVPATGGDVLARHAALTVGGAFNIVAAAARQGLPVLFGGRYGGEQFGRMVGEALAAEGIEPLLSPTPGEDTGFCVVLVDAAGERTMVTTMGVEAYLRAEDLERVAVREDDLVHLSGYDLAYPHGPLLARWLRESGAAAIFDPGPLVADLPADLVEDALRCSSWVSLNAREARLLTGEERPAAAARAIAARSDAGVVVREGPAGALVLARGESTTVGGDGATAGGGPVRVGAFATDVVDTTGAGDAHVGAFAAALARGLPPAEACRWANAAAAAVVARWGAATAPRVDETAQRVSAQRVSPT